MPDPIQSGAEGERCGRIMIGSGSDTYDPTCDLPAGHSGVCKSYSAIDQNRLARPETPPSEEPERLEQKLRSAFDTTPPEEGTEPWAKSPFGAVEADYDKP